MKLDIPDKLFGGYIFDCDGTIADSMPLHYEAWSLAMEEVGGYISEEMHYSLGGMPNTAIVELLNKQFGFNLDPDDVVKRKHRHYLAKVHTVKPILPVLELAQKFQKFAPIAIASGGRRELVESTLRAIGAFDLFPVIVTADDYTNGKPNPEPFLLAAKWMQVKPEDCLVFDDGATGQEAAHRAGMAFVLVPSNTAPKE